MYERFTDRARKVMQYANQEAQKLNHEYVGTEHMLLGLLKEGGGVAAMALRLLNADNDRLRDDVVKLVTPGPDMVSMGKLPQSPRAKKVVEYAMQTAKEMNCNYVGTEHVLCGLARESEGIASQVLGNNGITFPKLRAAIEEVLSDDGGEAGKPTETNRITAQKLAQSWTLNIGVDRTLTPSQVKALARKRISELESGIKDSRTNIANSEAELNEWRAILGEQLSLSPTV